jgi:hypothetical protein
MGAMLAFARRHRSTLGDLASRQMLQWAVILLLFGFATPGSTIWRTWAASHRDNLLGGSCRASTNGVKVAPFSCSRRRCSA